MLIGIQSSSNIKNFNILTLKSIFLGYLRFRAAQSQPAGRLAALYKIIWLNHMVCGKYLSILEIKLTENVN